MHLATCVWGGVASVARRTPIVEERIPSFRWRYSEMEEVQSDVSYFITSLHRLACLAPPLRASGIADAAVGTRRPTGSVERTAGPQQPSGLRCSMFRLLT